MGFLNWLFGLAEADEVEEGIRAHPPQLRNGHEVVTRVDDENGRGYMEYITDLNTGHKRTVRYGGQ